MEKAKFPEIDFLKEDLLGPTVALSSYPRSGNTLIRTYIEKLTCVRSGSDCDKRRNLNKMLYEMGMKGEGVTDKTVLIVKTHYPERIGY